MNEPRIYIVTPVYFDVKSFLQLRTDITICIRSCEAVSKLLLKFIVVDDSAGSDVEVLDLDVLPDVEVVAMPVNSGHQKAIVYALRSLSMKLNNNDFVITMDADGEDIPVDVTKLITSVLNHSELQSPIAIAQRIGREESVKFRILYFFFKTFFKILTGSKIKSGNFALQRGRVIKQTINHPSFDLCYSTTLFALNKNIVWVPCKRGQRFEGSSKMNTYSLIAHGIRMLLPLWEKICVRMLGWTAALIAVALSLSTFLITMIYFFGQDFGSIFLIPITLFMTGLTTLFSAVSLFAIFSQSKIYQNF